MNAESAVRAYRRGSEVRSAFRGIETVASELGQGPHRRDLIRALAFLCLLADHVEWHMKKALAPLLVDGEGRQGEKVPHMASGNVSFQALLQNLATICKNKIQPRKPRAQPFEQITTLTRQQVRIFGLLGAPYPM
jgi:hypothetical protein